MTETRTLQQDKLLPRDSRDFFGHVYIICYSKLPLCSQKTVRLLVEIMSAQSGGYWLLIHFGDEAE